MTQPATPPRPRLERDLLAFVAGSAYPVVVVPFTYLGLAYHARPVPELGYELAPIALPAVFGLANVAFARWGERLPARSREGRLLLAGALFGLGLSLYGLLVEDVPGRLFGLAGAWRYAVLVAAPLLYAAVWRWIVGGLNRLVGLG